MTNAPEVRRLLCELVTDQLLQIPHGFLKDFQGSFRVPPDFAMDSTRSFQDSLWVCYRFPTSTDSEIIDIGLSEILLDLQMILSGLQMDSLQISQRPPNDCPGIHLGS